MKHIGKLNLYSSDEVSQDSRVSIGFECLDRDLFNPDKCYDLLKKSGVKYARCQTGWAKCEKEKGVYDFTWLDGIINNLTERGIIVWLSVSFGNTLYMPDAPSDAAVGCVPLYYGSECEKAWERFAAKIAERYKEVVSFYEIWNEPDIEHFWYPKKPDGAEYARLVEQTGAVIKKVNPKAKIGGCISGFNFRFFSDFAKNIEASVIDFYSFHAYGKEPEYNYRERTALLRHILDSNGLSKVKLWQGESGYPSWAPEKHWLGFTHPVSERQQAIWQLRRFFLDIEGGVERTSFFQMADMWEKEYQKAVEVLKKPAAHGILNGITYTPKKSYETISILSALFNGNVTKSSIPFFGYADEEISRKLSLQLISLKKDIYQMYAYYLPTEIELEERIDSTFEICFPEEEKIENPIVIDTYTGEAFQPEDIYFMNGMMCIKNLPLREYPIVVCDKSVYNIEKM